MANVGMVGLDWQERINWGRMRTYRLERARERMKAHGLGAMLLMYDENVRYVTSTLTPGWNKLKPGLRYCLLCGDDAPVLFEQGDIGLHIEKHSPWIPKENIRYSYAWIKGAAGPASTIYRMIGRKGLSAVMSRGRNCTRLISDSANTHQFTNNEMTQ
jgi:Xaa-Pro dipeptidase